MATKTDNSSEDYKREIKRVVKGLAQCVVKGTMSKTASITCNRH